MAVGAVGWPKHSPTCPITPRALVGLLIVSPVKDVPQVRRSCAGFTDLAKPLDKGADLFVAEVSLECIWRFWGGSETANEAPTLVLDIA